MQARNPQKIPLAHAGPINDALLEQVIFAARDAQNNEVSHDAGTLLIMCAAPLLEELLQYRRKMEVIADLANTANVVLLRPDTGQ